MIIHLDLDCFFASCERLRNPSLLGKRLVVGGRGDPFIFDKKPAQAKKLITLNSGAFVPSLFHASHDASHYFNDGDKIRGIVTTASYEARAFGVKTGMSIYEALRLCPDLILVPPNHLLYHTLSHELMEYLATVVPVMEQYSIDEMFGDLRGWIEEEETENFIKHLQEQITKEFKLPVSIGASSSKWIAKLATSTAKPYGIRVVPKKEIEAFVKSIPIDEFPGIGKAFSAKMSHYGIKTVGDAWTSETLIHSWGRHGKDLYARLTGSDNEPISASRSRKGIGMSRSMDHPVKERAELFRRISVMVRHWSHTIMKLGVNPTTYAFSLGYENWGSSKKQYTTYRLFNEPFIQHFAHEKFKELDLYPHIPIRYIAMSATKFIHHDPKTFNILEYDNDTKMRSLTDALTQMREKYGMDIVRGGSEL
ncbi:MAG: DNA polymerase IV [Sulfuricurvum sp.]|uniref:DNA polymerase Y family protein n=1 Tax=Sulfuricurvum sp. TaxID=2025608 RepID=UPI0026233E1E|nr:DNA polymerase IV [Sulfuricurvum sp.]MDD2369005.1 DNA polymerase IV [Sulfuricurvum sp.]MDD5119130.1 DNA polymerase IV [Sulfuricurvum sp.]